MRLKNLSNQELSLSQILDSSRKGEYAIPVFQRDYVWKKNQCRALADSIIRGYPISSMLFMATNGRLNVKADALRSPQATLVDGGQFYVMDGQQRVTSMYQVFEADAADKYNYYFDLLSLLCVLFPERDIEGKMTVADRNPDIDTECLCSIFKSTDRSRHDGRFVRSKEVAQGRFASHLANFIQSLRDMAFDESECEDYFNTLNGVLGDVSHYMVPVVYISPDSDLETICHIFEKVNSSGTKLTPLDLINAKTHGAVSTYEGGITSYVSDRILSSRIHRADGPIRGIIDDVLKFDASAGRFTALNPLLKALHISVLIRNGATRPKVTTAAMLGREAETWFSDWDAMEADILTALEWGAESGILSATQSSLWELLLGICIGLPEAFRMPQFKTAILRYAFGLIISDSALSRSEVVRTISFVEYGIDMARRGINHRQIGQRPGDDIVITLQNIEKATVGRKSFRAIQSIMYAIQFQGLFGVDITDRKISSSTSDEHHLVPKASGCTSPYMNSIANIVYLNSEANRYQIRDSSIPDMKDMILKHLNGDTEHCRRVFEANLIPENYTTDQQFLADRANMVLKYVNAYLQPRIQD